jgi:predicted phosphodiesterase
MSLKDEVSLNEDEKKVIDLETKLRLKSTEVSKLRAFIAKQSEEMAQLQTILEGLKDIHGLSTQPKWLSPRKVNHRHHRAIPTLLLSDLHLDEVVCKAEVEGYNEYNREIALVRLAEVFEKAVDLPNTYMSGFAFDGFILALGGDIVTGDIHQEYIRTNEATLFETISFWVPKLAEGINYIADIYGRVHVPCVVGNHDRNPANHRSPFKKRAQDSASWVIYKWLADKLSADKRITFDIAQSMDCTYDVYSTKYLLTHGDQFRGGGGVAGIFTPVVKGRTTKLERQKALGNPFDILIMGHWHQLVFGPNFIVNNSLKGYDEFAYGMNFKPEPPSQAFWITTPERGLSMTMPIYV